MEALLAPLLAGGVVDDPWLDGRPRLSGEPALLAPAEAGALAEAACALAMMLDEAVPAVAADPALAAVLGLDPTLAAVAAIDAPRWLGLARADVFFTDGGGPPQVCELNCDTPTGLAECVELGRLAAARHPGDADPSARLRERWLAMVAAAAAGIERPTVGIVDPTEITEDLGHVRLLTRWLEDAGFAVARGAPFNLHACADGRVGLFGIGIDVLIRHYKTDWWSHRSSPWRDEPAPPDAAPLARQLGLLARAQADGRLMVLNPWGSALAQDKRSLALPWERPDLFRAGTLAAVRRHLPETRFLESLSADRLIGEREDWALKSDFGCEGEEVLLGSATAPAAWAEALLQAVPGRWIAQRAFRPRRDAEGRCANHGVFLVGGRPSGIYTRRSAGPTGRDAISCPTLVRR